MLDGALYASPLGLLPHRLQPALKLTFAVGTAGPPQLPPVDWLLCTKPQPPSELHEFEPLQVW